MTPEAIVRALADNGAVLMNESGCFLECALCHATAREGAGPGVEHEPDCEWRLAVEWCAAEDTRQANMAAVHKLHDDALRHLAAGDCRGPAEVTLIGGPPAFACTRYGERRCVECPGEAAANLKHGTGGEGR